MAAEGFKTSDISVLISYIMAPKDEKELAILRKCSAGLCDIFKKCYWEEMMKAIESNRVKMISIRFRNECTVTKFQQ